MDLKAPKLQILQLTTMINCLVEDHTYFQETLLNTFIVHSINKMIK